MEAFDAGGGGGACPSRHNAIIYHTPVPHIPRVELQRSPSLPPQSNTSPWANAPYARHALVVRTELGARQNHFPLERIVLIHVDARVAEIGGHRVVAGPRGQFRSQRCRQHWDLRQGMPCCNHVAIVCPQQGLHLHER